MKQRETEDEAGYSTSPNLHVQTTHVSGWTAGSRADDEQKTARTGGRAEDRVHRRRRPWAEGDPGTAAGGRRAQAEQMAARARVKTGTAASGRRPGHPARVQGGRPRADEEDADVRTTATGRPA
jgi:hypothetical protein